MASVAGPSTLLVPRTPSPDDIESRRTSVLSTSAGSFQTAHSALASPSQASFRSLKSSSSNNTVNASKSATPNGDMNPVRIISQTGTTEVHIVKVAGDKVELQTGSSPESLLQRAGKSVAHVVTNAPISTVGPLPPSPPPSVDRDEDNRQVLPIPRSASPTFVISHSEPPTPTPIANLNAKALDKANGWPARAPVKLEVSVPPKRSPGRSSVHSGAPTERPEPPSPTVTTTTVSTALPTRDGLRQRSSTETRMSARTSLTGLSSQRITYTSSTFADEPSTPPTSDPASSASERERRTSSSVKGSHLSMDGYLHPPPTIVGPVPRPARRNTTGSTGTHLSKRQTRGQPSLQSQHARAHDDAFTGTLQQYGELDSDILQQADQIRRERMTKRRQQEAEMALVKEKSKGDDAGVLVGNLIGEGHVNYVLMYNMLTGIRIGVSRCTAKIKRPLTDEDFSARHKYSFDIVGNELTPSAKYDFKFKDYAPWVFRELRENYFGLDPADYLLSLTSKYILSELGSPGKSGSFFYFSRDYRFIIKTIHHTEHKFLRTVLKKYYDHMRDNPHTLLSRFYGLHRVKLPHGRKIHFVIMNNLFPPHKDVHETYDLKGSTVGREFPEEKAQKNPRAVLKDLNWINRGKSLELGPEKRALLTEQLRRDSEFLKELNVMDYSLLVGIHSMKRGNRDNVRSNTLKVFSPNVPHPFKRKPTAAQGMSPEAIAMRRAMRESADPSKLNSLNLPEEDTGDRQQFLFYQDEGGLRATDEQNHPMETIYYLGIIDILTPYTVLKRMEHFWKGLSADRHKISPVPSEEYGNRFFDFMKAVMRGGGGGARFKAE